jgi:hypothetical protein
MSKKAITLFTPLIPELISKKNDVYFDVSKMSPATPMYVCWIDVMGSQSAMLRSLPMAANFLMKLHIAALTAYEDYDVDIYPVIDGVYLCSQSQLKILGFVNRVYSMVAKAFADEEEPWHRSLIRSGIAFGPVVTGTGTLACADELKDHTVYAERVFLGPPLTQAYQIEKKTAPFGVGLHETMRSLSVRTLPLKNGTTMLGTHWKWWRHGIEDSLASDLFKSLKNHYDWCSNHTVVLSYEKADIERHRALVEEYFSD